MLTVEETKLGWVEFVCDRHGFLVATTKNATVWCQCGKRARASRHGRLVDPDTLKPTEAQAKEFNKLDQPYIHGCRDCGEDFGGAKLQGRHRAGGVGRKYCLTPDQMLAKGWHMDKKGRWREVRSTSFVGQDVGRNSDEIAPIQPEEGTSHVPGTPEASTTPAPSESADV